MPDEVGMSSAASTTAPAKRVARARTGYDKRTPSLSRAYGVSCRARAERVALRRNSGDSPREARWPHRVPRSQMPGASGIRLGLFTLSARQPIEDRRRMSQPGSASAPRRAALSAGMASPTLASALMESDYSPQDVAELLAARRHPARRRARARGVRGGPDRRRPPGPARRARAARRTRSPVRSRSCSTAAAAAARRWPPRPSARPGSTPTTWPAGCSSGRPRDCRSSPTAATWRSRARGRTSRSRSTAPLATECRDRGSRPARQTRLRRFGAR